MLRTYEFIYLMKDTGRITGLINFIARIDGCVLHLDVGLIYSIKAVWLCEERAHLVCVYVSWVQNDENQFGPYLLKTRNC